MDICGCMIIEKWENEHCKAEPSFREDRAMDPTRGGRDYWDPGSMGQMRLWICMDKLIIGNNYTSCSETWKNSERDCEKAEKRKGWEQGKSDSLFPRA